MEYDSFFLTYKDWILAGILVLAAIVVFGYLYYGTPRDMVIIDLDDQLDYVKGRNLDVCRTYVSLDVGSKKEYYPMWRIRKITKYQKSQGGR